MNQPEQSSSNFFVIHTPKGERKIGEGCPAFIVAEMSANHNQDYATAVKIIRAAAEAGADAIKLQTYTPDTITMNCDNKYFVIENKHNPDLWQKKNLYQLYQKAYTPWEWHEKLKNVAEENGIVFFSTPFDETAVDFLEKLAVPMYKVASYEITHLPLLKRIAQTGKPVIMSTGFASQEEVKEAVETLRKNGTTEIVILHCVTAYSETPLLEETNLQTILDLRDQFQVICGFSDNNAGIEIPLHAAMMGAAIIEKHFVADTNTKTFDSDFSIGPKEFKDFVDAVRRAEKVKGTVKYGPQSKKEVENMIYRRSLFTVQNIKKGEIFTEKNVRVIRPSFGLPPKYYWDVLGKTAKIDIERGTPLSWELIG